MNKVRRNRMSLLWFIMPFTLLYVVFFLYPFTKGLLLSFTDWNGISKTTQYVGFQNYLELFTEDSRFLHSLFVTLIFTVLNVAISNICALVLAVAIEWGSRSFRNLLRTLFFLPYVFSLVVVGFVWRLLYTEVLPKLSEQIHWQFFNLDYIGDPAIALYSTIFMNIWYGIGYFLIIYLAGLQTIDTSVLEASQIDGATGWVQFTKIIIPLLMPSITICIFTSIAGSLKIFDAIFVLTGGGPGYSTESIALNIYYEAYGAANRFGYGMAKAVVLAGVILFISYFQLKFFKAKEVEV
ncbi:carbohydrate ABC transporter permease [Cohnella silvisoli]|uniref:Sugar ABC transporter permease n=1 Tax=Cohnella silvisoli TaxID=2873699 RepID=A0ABV1KL81_9BACL|nr:sugar ABC transporter permease [Cohnella silvisoli]MCD9020771.1 sugar ABC transporter permease [Cohnella silvisoli]